MRRRLFWTIAGVAIVMGSLVLIAALVSSQRAAIDATERELERAATQVAPLIEDAIERGENRPSAMAELFALLQEDRFVALLARLQAAAGGSELSFGAVAPNGQSTTNGDIFEKLSLDLTTISAGDSDFYETEDEMVLVTASNLAIADVDVVFITALVRERPVVNLADRSGSLLLIFIGMLLVSALVARLLADRTIQSLRPLAAASRSLASGDLAARVPDPGDPELVDLVESFNEMAQELGASRVREREFLLGVGHDLRTPLTTIAGYAEALETGDIDESELQHIGVVLGKQSRQLSRLIEDITLLARLEQPEFDLRLEPVELGAHISEVVQGFRLRADEFGIDLDVEAGEIPPIVTDPDRVAQIAHNLVQNALRFTPAMGTVTVRVDKADSGALLEVEDTGAGISAQDLPRIFDRHFAAGGQRQLRNEGTGLGLSIVRGLTERLGGSVSAESEKGSGTTISVTIPDLSN